MSAVHAGWRSRGGDAIYGTETWLADTVGALVCLAPASTCCRRARHAAWGGSPVGGHGDVFSGGSTWTVTGPLFSLYCSSLVLFCALLITCYAHVRFEYFQQTSTHHFYSFRRRQPNMLVGMGFRSGVVGRARPCLTCPAKLLHPGNGSPREPGWRACLLQTDYLSQLS